MQRRAAWGLACFVLVACVDDVVTLDTDGTSSSSSSSSSTGGASSPSGDASSTTGFVDPSSSSSGGLECVDETDCASLAGPCADAVCAEGVCELRPFDAGTPPQTQCDGAVCDGEGACVDCIEDRDCGPVALCEIASCEAGVCMASKDTTDACAPWEGMLGYASPQGMLRIDPSTGLMLAGAQDQLHARTFHGSRVRHVAVDPSTGEFVVNTLRRMDPDSGPAVLFAVSTFEIEARTFHPDTGALWVMYQSQLEERDPSSGQPLSSLQPTTLGPKGPESANLEAMAFDDAGALYALYEGALHTVDLSSGALTSLFDVPSDARGLVFDPATGSLYAASSSDELYAIDPDGAGALSLSFPGMPQMQRIAFDPVAEVLYGFSGAEGFQGDSRTLYTLDPTDGSWAFVRRIGVPDVRSMAYESATERMLIASSVGLVSVDRETQTFDLISAPSPELSVIAFDDGGNLFGITRFDPVLLAIDPSDGSSIEISALTADSYVDMTFDPGSGQFFATRDADPQSLAKELRTIDPISGAEVVLGSSNITGGLTYEAASERIYGLDVQYNLVSVDPGSGSPLGEVIGRSGYVGHEPPMTTVEGVVTSFATPTGFGDRNGAVTFDLSTGQASFEGTPGWIDAVAYDPPTGDLLLTTSLLGVDTAFRFDPATNVSTTYADVSPDTFAGDFAIAADGTGYVSRFNEFSRYDPATGETTLLGTIAGLGPFAFDDEDLLFAVVGDDLVTIDPRTAGTSFIGEIGLPIVELQWDGVNDRLVGITGDGVSVDGTYVELDPSTGSATVLTEGLPYSGISIQLAASRG